MLDEASSNIDPETDAILQRMVREEFKNCTKLIIAHRLGTILDADSILVLDAGLITEHASPSKLLDNPQSHLSEAVESIVRRQQPRLEHLLLNRNALNNLRTWNQIYN